MRRITSNASRYSMTEHGDVIVPPFSLPPSRLRAATVSAHLHTVEQSIREMQSQLAAPLSLSRMAEMACTSSFHFNRIFCQVTGIPPGRFLWALRLEAAKRLLLTTQNSVIDVCFDVGYNSLGTFTSRFTQLVGVSPNRFRALAKSFFNSNWETLPFLEKDNHPRLPLPNTMAGRVGFSSASLFTGVIFVGLFTTPFPQGRPVRCTLLTSPGHYKVQDVPDGRYFILAAAFPWPDDPLALLLPNSSQLYVGDGRGPIIVSKGQFYGATDVLLRSMEITDPPFLTALPLLLAENLGIA